jgi:hypothetical protein
VVASWQKSVSPLSCLQKGRSIMSEHQDWWSMTESVNSIIVVIDGPADTTIRPARPNILGDYPRPLVPSDRRPKRPEPPPSQKEEDKKPPSEEEGDQKTPE